MNKTLILKKTKDFDYVLVKITQDECKEIEELCKKGVEYDEKYSFISEFIMCGHISEPTEKDLENLIPIYRTWIDRTETGRGIENIEYFCYAKPNRNPNIFSSNVRIHEDRLSAFKGVYLSMNCQYFYIRKQPVLWIGEFQSMRMEMIDMSETNTKEDEHTTNNSNDSEVRSEDTSERETES